MEGGLTVFAGLKVNTSYLEVPGCWSSTTRKDAGSAEGDAGPCGCCTLEQRPKAELYCSRLWCGYLCRLHNWYRDWLSIRYGMYSRPAVVCVTAVS